MLGDGHLLSGLGHGAAGHENVRMDGMMGKSEMALVGVCRCKA